MLRVLFELFLVLIVIWIVISLSLSLFKAVKEDCNVKFGIEKSFHINGGLFCPVKRSL